MLCSICNQREASVHMTQIVGNKMQKADLCEECARERGMTDPAGYMLADLMLGMGTSPKAEPAPGAPYYIDVTKLAKPRKNNPGNRPSI
jgi:protein arginine kinase activator